MGPFLPEAIGQLELLNIPGRWGHIDAFGRGRHQVECTSDSGPLSERLSALFESEPARVPQPVNLRSP